MTPKKKAGGKPDQSKEIKGKTEALDRFRTPNFLAGCLIGVIFIVSVLTAKHYGFTWDEPVDLYFAERNLRYLLTFDPSWLNLDKPYIFEVKGLHPYLSYGYSPLHTLVFGNLLSSMGCYLFYEKLGLMNSIAAHHFPNKLLLVGLLATIFVFVRRNWGAAIAFAAIPAIAFQPRLWADMQFNLKDFPFACFMAFTLIAIRSAILMYCWKRILLSATLLGLCAATKPNAALIAVIIPIWLYFGRSSMMEVGGKSKKLFWIAVVWSPIISVLTYILVWPYLWDNITGKMLIFLRYYLSVAGKGPPHFQWDKIYLFLSVQPPAVLLFAAIGVTVATIDAVKGIRRELNVFLLLWLILPILRVALPKAYDYDGVRHFIEYSPPLGILTGVGFVFFCGWFYKKLAHRIPQKIAVGLVVFSAAVLPIGWAYSMIKIHPYEIVYFNFLVGGAKGAQERWPTATDYWGSSYRDGIRWLNLNAERGAIIAVPVAQHLVFDTRTMWLRDDLVLLGNYLDRFTPQPETLANELFQKTDRPMYIMYITRPDWYTNLVKYLESQEKPVYMITVDGAPILKIFRNNGSVQNRQ